jgi:hypothetical protein
MIGSILKLSAGVVLDESDDGGADEAPAGRYSYYTKVKHCCRSLLGSKEQRLKKKSNMLVSFLLLYDVVNASKHWRLQIRIMYHKQHLPHRVFYLWMLRFVPKAQQPIHQVLPAATYGTSRPTKSICT